MNLLTVDELKPGVRYRVVDVGNADPDFQGAVVLGAHSGCAYAAVTIEMDPKHDPKNAWIGAPWIGTRHAEHYANEDPDTDARFCLADEYACP